MRFAIVAGVISLILISTPLLCAAITPDASVNTDQLGISTGATWTHTVGSPCNYAVLYVLIGGTSGGGDPTGVTIDSAESMILVKNISGLGQIWEMVNPPRGAHKIVASWPSTVNGYDARYITSVSFCNVNQNYPSSTVGASISASTTATGLSSATATVITTVAGSMLLGLGFSGNATSMTPTTGQTELHNIKSGYMHVAYGYQSAPAAGSNTITWTQSGGDTNTGMVLLALSPYATPLTIPGGRVSYSPPAPLMLRPYQNSTYNIPADSGGDTQFFTWTSAATRPGNWGGGSIVGTYNDGSGFGCTGSAVCMYEITAYDPTVPSATITNVNQLRSYTNGPNTACFNGIYTMKSRKPWAFDGVLFLPIFCMSGPPDFFAYSSGFIVSPDGGNNWCNYKTFNTHSGSPDCDSSNWQPFGDNPTAADGFQWPAADGATTSKFTRMQIVDFLCQDNTINCPVADGVDPAYLYFITAPNVNTTTSYLLRFPKSVGWRGAMNLSNWQEYNAGTWEPISNNTPSDISSGVLQSCCQSIAYLKDSTVFTSWQHLNNYMYTAKFPWGPWTIGATAPLSYTQGFPGPVAGLCPKYGGGRILCTVSSSPGSQLRLTELDLGPVGHAWSSGGGGPGRTSGGSGGGSGTTSGGSSAAITVTTVATSNTQALLAYAAPDSNPCQIEISESATLSPLVHDVDQVLFTGANNDNRPGNLTSGVNRVAVIGLRYVQQGSDGYFYSRALQASTTHYGKVSCNSGAQTGTFSFTTKNIPIGSTFTELPQSDPVTGLGTIPTFPQDRTTPVIDPHTGALAKRVHIAADGMSVGLFSGGSLSPCGSVTVTPSSGPGPGYFCSFNTYDGSPSEAYWIYPPTGETHYLGRTMFASTADYDTVIPVGQMTPGAAATIIIITQSRVDNTKYLILEGVYSGDFSDSPPGTITPFTVTILTPLPNSIDVLLHAYNTAFDYSKFNCGLSPNIDYGYISCRRGEQDSYGWIFAVRLSDSTVIAGMNLQANVKTRWCGEHTFNQIPETPITYNIYHGLSGGCSSNFVGCGPYQTTLSKSILSTDTTFSVATEPLNINDATVEPYLTEAAVGDQAFLSGGGNKEEVAITGKTGLSWTVTRNSDHAPGHIALAWPAGAQITMDCGTWNGALWRDMWWRFLDDPNGTGSGFFYETQLQTSHDDIEKAGRTSGIFNGVIPLGENMPPTFSLTDPMFAGKSANAYGDAASDYSSYQAGSVPWYTDERQFRGVEQQYGSSALESGKTNTYRYTPYGLFTGPTLDRKQMESLVIWGGSSLKDISGPVSDPSTHLGDTSASYYLYCIPNVAGECIPSRSPATAPGEIYVNVPSPLFDKDCRAADGIYDVSAKTICATNLMPTGGVLQLGLTSNTVGLPSGDTAHVGWGYTRQLTSGFSGLRNMGRLAKPLRDGSWMFVNDGVTHSILPYPVTAATWSGGYATLTIGTHNLIVGQHVIVTGMNPPGYNVSLENAKLITAISSTTITYHLATEADPGPFVSGGIADVVLGLLMVKMLPYPAPDGVDRSTFVRAPISNITPPAGMGIASATVEFWYAEYSGYCTTRAETCVAVASTVTDSNPFYFKTTDTYTKAACTSSSPCTITLPVLPMHVAYYQVKFYDGSGTFVTNGAAGVALESTVH